MPCEDCQEQMQQISAALPKRVEWERRARRVLSDAAAHVPPAMAAQIMSLLGDLNEISLLDKMERGGAVDVIHG